MKKITISVEDSVYAGLHATIGQGHISRFINELVKPHLLAAELDSAYKEMAKDKEYEKMANEWSENLISDIGESEWN